MVKYNPTAMKIKFQILPFIILITLGLISITNFSGCAPTLKPLQGNYSSGPYQITTSKSFDEVWSNVIDMFATDGISIKVIDKSSGLIITEKYSFINHYTYEGYNGQLKPIPGLLPTPIDPNAWVVVSRIVTDTDIKPREILGEWNVRLKPLENGKTSINVNLVNLKASAQIIPLGGTSYTEVLDVKSTGKFEQMIIDSLK